MSTLVNLSNGDNIDAINLMTNFNNLNTDKVETLSDLSVTSSSTELNYLDGTTLGTAVASKALAVDSNKDISALRNVGGTGTCTFTGNIITSGSFVIGSASMNETDLEKIDGITNGTVAANKAVVVDANKDASEFRNLGFSGALAMGASSTITANSETVTDNQIGYLNDVTSDIQAQLDGKEAVNKLSTVTWTGNASTQSVAVGFTPTFVIAQIASGSNFYTLTYTTGSEPVGAWADAGSASGWDININGSNLDLTNNSANQSGKVSYAACFA